MVKIITKQWNHDADKKQGNGSDELEKAVNEFLTSLPKIKVISIEFSSASKDRWDYVLQSVLIYYTVD